MLIGLGAESAALRRPDPVSTQLNDESNLMLKSMSDCAAVSLINNGLEILESECSEWNVMI